MKPGPFGTFEKWTWVSSQEEFNHLGILLAFAREVEGVDYRFEPRGLRMKRPTHTRSFAETIDELSETNVGINPAKSSANTDTDPKPVPEMETEDVPRVNKESTRIDAVSEPVMLRDRRSLLEDRLARLQRRLDIETSKQYSSNKYEEERIRKAIESARAELAELNSRHLQASVESNLQDARPRFRQGFRIGRSFNRLTRIRLKRIYVYLLMTAFIFGLSLYLVPSINTIVMALISLFNGLVVFTVVYGIAGIRHRGIGHKLFAIVLILLVFGFLYQNPLLVRPATASKELIQSENSYVSALGSPSSNGNPSGPDVLGALGGIYNALSSSLSSLGKNLASSGQTNVDSLWVKDFMGNVSTLGGARTLNENLRLDQLAKERFNTMTQHPDITHYGADYELPPGTGEVVFYPSGQTPGEFAVYIRTTAPAHWNLMTSGFASYGYYSASGPSYDVNQGCPNTELPGPGINVTQFFQQEGCTVYKVTASWLVIDFG
jgi:hypothetical protein